MISGAFAQKWLSKVHHSATESSPHSAIYDFYLINSDVRHVIHCQLNIFQLVCVSLHVSIGCEIATVVRE